jgi:hypothetical protein
MTDHQPSALDLADRHLLHDLQIYWQRANVFLVVQGVLFAFATNAIVDRTERYAVWPIVLVALIAIAVCLLWLAVAVLTNARITEWSRVVHQEASACGFERIALAERVVRHRSPSRWSDALPGLFVVGWLSFLLALLCMK